MNRFLGVAIALCWLEMGTAAQAQMGYPYAQPNYGPGYQTPLSPYLNLLRGGNTASNYFLGTIPEVERRSNQRSVQSSLQFLEQRQETGTGTADDIVTPLPGTGHATAFGNFGTYFNQAPRLTLGPPGAQSTRRR